MKFPSARRSAFPWGTQARPAEVDAAASPAAQLQAWNRCLAMLPGRKHAAAAFGRRRPAHGASRIDIDMEKGCAHGNGSSGRAADQGLGTVRCRPTSPKDAGLANLKPAAQTGR